MGIFNIFNKKETKNPHLEYSMSEEEKKVYKDLAIVQKICQEGKDQIKILSIFNKKNINHQKRFKMAQDYVEYKDLNEDDYVVKASYEDFVCFQKFWMDCLINIEIVKTGKILESKNISVVELDTKFTQAIEDAGI